MSGNTYRWKEQAVTIKGSFRLSGTLTVPEGVKDTRLFPAMLILSGSGKGDRDGNLKGLKLNMYKDIAEVAARSGLVTLRYDKRGTHGSEGSYMSAGLWDFIDDAECAVRYLKQLSFVDAKRVIVLGHSEGAMIAPAIASRESLGGLILLCGAAEAGKQLIWRQSRQLFAEIAQLPGLKGKLLRFINKIQKAEERNEKLINKILNSKKDVHRMMGLVPLNAKWMREMYAYDVTAYLPSIKCPTLAIGGEKDIQVAPEHTKVLAESVSGKSEWHLIPNMNHILRTYDKPHTWLQLKKEYKKLAREPLNPELVNLLTTWLRTYFPPERSDR